jgi:hypothetical protein
VPLTPIEIEQILVAAGLDPKGASVTTLEGGISSETLAVQLPTGSYVVKRALSQLRVEEEWRADPERIFAEGEALEWFNDLTPEYAPRPLAAVEKSWALLLPMAPSPSPDLRRIILDSPLLFQEEAARTLGKILFEWHAADPGKALGSRLDDITRLTDLRVDPFYRDMAGRWASHQKVIYALAEELLEVRTAVVHGDFTPKNVLILPDGGLWVIDSEVSHIGNPVIDTAAMVAHLLLKQVLYRKDAHIHATLRRAQKAFLSELGPESCPSSLGGHVGLFMAVRVAGRAQVPYLSEELRSAASQIARDLLEGASLEEVGS